MVNKKADQLRDVGDEDLEAQLLEAKHELFNLRFQLVTGQLDNPMAIKVVRKQVARLLTIMRERELEAHEGEDAPAAEEA